MAARKRELQSSTGLQLASDFSQVRAAAPVGGGLARRRSGRNPAVWVEAQGVRQFDAGRGRPRVPAPVRAHEHRRLSQSCRRNDLDAVRERRLGGTVRRHDHAPHSPPRQGGDHGQQTWHRAQVAAER